MALFSWYTAHNSNDKKKTKSNFYGKGDNLDSENTTLLVDCASQDTDLDEVIIRDRNGDGMVLKSYGDRLWPTTMKNVSSIKEFSARTDDIFLCSYSRSGSHLVWELILLLMNNNPHLQECTKLDTLLEYVGCDHLDSKRSPRVINTHLNYSLLPPGVFRKNCKIVLVNRNPKDVAVSYYNYVESAQHFQYDGKFGGFLDMFLEGNVAYGSWFEYTQEWDTAIKTGTKCQIFVVYYEKLKENFVETVSQLCSFLDLSRPQKFLQQMKEAPPFVSFKAEKHSTYNKTMPVGRGVIGDWKKWFTVAQNENFDQLCRERLQNSVFKFIYEPDPTRAM